MLEAARGETTSTESKIDIFEFLSRHEFEVAKRTLGDVPFSNATGRGGPELGMPSANLSAMPEHEKVRYDTEHDQDREQQVGDQPHVLAAMKGSD